MSERQPHRPTFFVSSRATGTRFSGLGWPLWKVMLLCFGIGGGCALFAALLGLLMRALHP